MTKRVEDKRVEDTPSEEEIRRVTAYFGRIGGKLGGPARAAKLSPEERSEIARKASTKRWGHRRFTNEELLTYYSQDLTLADIGRQMGLSRQRAEQIYRTQVQPLTGESSKDRLFRRSRARRITDALIAHPTLRVVVEEAQQHGLPVTLVEQPDLHRGRVTFRRILGRQLWINKHLCSISHSVAAGFMGAAGHSKYYRVILTNGDAEFRIVVVPETTFIFPRVAVQAYLRGRKSATLFIRQMGPSKYNNHKPTLDSWQYADRWDLLGGADGNSAV